jgi:hypothetical protein
MHKQNRPMDWQPPEVSPANPAEREHKLRVLAAAAAVGLFPSLPELVAGPQPQPACWMGKQ